jgi:hypothetical protein
LPTANCRLIASAERGVSTEHVDGPTTELTISHGLERPPGGQFASRWRKKGKNAVTRGAEMPVQPAKELFGEGLAFGLFFLWAFFRARSASR